MVFDKINESLENIWKIVKLLKRKLELQDDINTNNADTIQGIMDVQKETLDLITQLQKKIETLENREKQYDKDNLEV